jgi:hypothetical protein
MLQGALLVLALVLASQAYTLRPSASAVPRKANQGPPQEFAAKSLPTPAAGAQTYDCS